MSQETYNYNVRRINEINTLGIAAFKYYIDKCNDVLTAQIYLDKVICRYIKEEKLLQDDIKSLENKLQI